MENVPHVQPEEFPMRGFFRSSGAAMTLATILLAVFSAAAQPFADAGCGAIELDSWHEAWAAVTGVDVED